MPSPSGRIVKISKSKNGTPHHKNHRWESFTAKIAKLNSLDPLKKVRRQDLDTEDLATTTSYFKEGLEKWHELNVSTQFVEFAHEVMPLCDSLPQILHFEDRIMDLLATYLQFKGKESTEPLLQLLTDFAHDLGPRFEKHYARALELVISIAGTSQEVDIIEWSFACLAFLFKFLSKLLIPDLRPTYDLMSRLLGKERQQPHIARFAAEAMSFLIKKAAGPGFRDKSLSIIVHHAKSDLISTYGSNQYELYYHGVMTMLAESIKGNGLSIHSSGQAIIHCMIVQFEGEEFIDGQQNPWENVIGGVLTSLVHHSSSDTLTDIIAEVTDQSVYAVQKLEAEQTPHNLKRVMLSARNIGIMAGVRKGSRIKDWPVLLRSLSMVLNSLSVNVKVLSSVESDEKLWECVVMSISIVLQYVPMELIIPFVPGYMTALSTEPFSRCFFTFCGYFGDVNPERFQSMVFPYFQRFVVAHWSEAENEDALCILLPNLVSSGALPTNSPMRKDGFNIPQSWQDQIVSEFERLELSPFPEQASNSLYGKAPQVWHERCLPKYRALLEILDSTTVHPSTNARIAEILLMKLKLALRPSSTLAPNEAHFILGRGLSAFCRMTKGAGSIDISLGPLLRAAAPRYTRLPNFLEANIAYETRLRECSTITPKSVPNSADSWAWYTDPEGNTDLLVSSLVENLSTESYLLRVLSLQLLDSRYRQFSGASSEVLRTMLLVEQTTLDLQTSRFASMNIRKLALMYKHHISDLVISRAIPFFLFGMLTVKFAQMWDDATLALAEVAETNIGESVIANIAFRWLEIPSEIPLGSVKKLEHGHAGGLTDFECSNMLKLNERSRSVLSQLKDSQSLMLKQFEREQQLVAAQNVGARAQALRVLSATPKIAERRSRQLVPMLLSWTLNEDKKSDETGLEMPEGRSDWTRRDQKAQLELFALFSNPSVLYKSTEVFTALLGLLANGDLDIQKSALKALFTWKSASIKPYEENLLNLLDEARFKDEIALIYQGQTIIQSQHRQEVMPVLLRLLYGRTLARKSVASGKQGMEARRLTVLRNLNTKDVGDFLDIALGKLNKFTLDVNDPSQYTKFESKILSVRKQVGFMNMMEDVLKELGSNITPFTPRVLPALLYCLIFATRQLQKVGDIGEDKDEVLSQVSMLKVVRQTGYKCLVLIFANDHLLDWSPFLTLILEELVSPRIDRLPVETAQGISGILRLLSTWSSSSRTVLFLGLDKTILLKIAECLNQQKAKDEVKLYSLQIIRNIVRHAREETDSENLAVSVRSNLMDENMDAFLSEIGHVLRNHQDPSRQLLESCVETVSDLSEFVSRSSQAHNLVDISVFLLDQPTRRVNPKTKSGLLKILEHFVPLYDLQDDVMLKDSVYNTVTSLFGFFRDTASREVLSRVLLVYARQDSLMSEVASLCKDLNSFADSRLDEPDYDRRLRAFSSIIKIRDIHFNARQWRPLLHNMLFYIRDDGEFGILSSNSCDGICRFLDIANECSEVPMKSEFQSMLSSIVLPALYSGVREESEVIRREFLKVMAHLVRTFSSWTDVSDMRGLLGGEDEAEASFFNNILTAGKGRQSGALGQLTIFAENGRLNSRNVNQFFIPLVEHFIFDRAEGSDSHNIAAEAMKSLGSLAGSLEWPQYRAMLRRYIGYIHSKPEIEKQVIKLLGKVIDALALAAGGTAKKPRAVDGADDNDSQTGQVFASQTRIGPPQNISTLAKTLPNQDKLTADLSSNILPPLIAYLHDKDESTVSLRTPVAVIAVRLLKLLPTEQMTERLPAVLTDICHILRSKSQESRDLTRDTLKKICVLLGPTCFGFVLKELRGALARGYQLHVLSYTMHAIMVATTPEYQPGDLDYCLPSVVAIIMDDIFGATGQEKDAEDYISKMKEVKSSKSHDSMELIAKTATLSRLTDLVRPIQVLLREKLNVRMVRKIDELLNRISTGLLKNESAQSRDSLIFCYEVIQDVYASKIPEKKFKEDYRLKRYLMQRGANKSGSRGSTTIYSYKLVRFAFDVMRSILKRHDNLRSASNLAGFVPLIGDALIQAEEEVKVAAFRLLAVISKVPLNFSSDGTNLYKIATIEAIRSISSASSTVSDVSQAALKLISVTLRDRKDVKIKDSSIDGLLGRLEDAITDPEHRHVTFNFLRAVLDSKVETATVYDMLDHVGTVMVTNDDRDTRDLARGAYFQFLRDYPQKKHRWAKQLAFIIANLKYDREGGRLSILEVIHLLLSKSSNDFVQEISATCFVPLIFVLINDDSEKCRMAAGEVIKEIFRKADNERMRTFSGLLRSWVEQHENPSVIRLGFMTYALRYEAQVGEYNTDVDRLQGSLLLVLDRANDLESDWELLYSALQLTLILCQKFPTTLLAPSAGALWTVIQRCLSYPHAWIKLSSARLVNILFADFARSTKEGGLETLPLRGSLGLQLFGQDITELIGRLLKVFATPGLTELLATESVKGLTFLGQCAGASNINWATSQRLVSADTHNDHDERDEEYKQGQQTALEFLFRRLSFILRRDASPPRAPTLVPKSAAIQLLQILCTKLTAEKISPSLPIILLPLHNLTDPTIPTPYSTDELFKICYEAIKSQSQELMSLLQNKCGTAQYTAQLLKVREGVKVRRNERSSKRKIEAVATPEKFGRDKKKKVGRKKERRKERSLEHRDQRLGW